MENILIVDDQPCIRELVSEELNREGYLVKSVSDAESLGKYLTSSSPDLVLLDLYLDDSDGFGVLRNIKRQHPHMPVLIFTAYDGYVDDSRLSQADGYVIKSCNLDKLKQKIADVLRHRSAPHLKRGQGHGFMRCRWDPV